MDETLKDDSLLEGVASGSIKKIVVAKIKIGSDLLAGIEEVVRRERIRKGIVLTGIGALQKAVFRNLMIFVERFPVEPKDRLYLEVTEPLELVSLTGHVATKEDGEPDVHCHFSASTVVGDTVQTLGGHLTEGTVAYLKAAVSIAVIEDIPMASRFSANTNSEELIVG